MTTQFDVVVSREALHDIGRLEAWLIDKDMAASAALGPLLQHAIQSLAYFPQRGKPSGPRTRDLIVPFGGSAYRIRYYIAGERVIVTAIWHSLERPA